MLYQRMSSTYPNNPLTLKYPKITLNYPNNNENSLHNIDYIAHQTNKEKQRYKWNILQVKIQQIRKEEKQFFYICNIEIALRQDAIGNKYNKKNNIC